jgi:hypothetical protein
MEIYRLITGWTLANSGNLFRGYLREFIYCVWLVIMVETRHTTSLHVFK